MNNKIIGFLLLIFSFSGGWLWMDYQNALHMPVVYKQAVVDIEKGDSFNQITDKLVGQKLTIKPLWFKVIAFKEKASTKIKTGEYELTPGMNITEILDLFVHGKTKQYSIIFPEGWSFKEILQEIEKNPHLEHTLNSTSTETLMAQLGANKNSLISPDHSAKTDSSSAIVENVPAVTNASPEGLLFPDTYFFDKHMSDVSLLKRAYDKMQQVLQQEWQNRAGDLPLKTPYEALILASIVEKETGEKTERPQIAGVFVRRLQQGMLLQTDPTVIYGMGQNYQGDIKTKDLTAATAYNTYVISGLPPTPIAMPGREAIHAALHPSDGDSLYFVARGDGTHVFSASLKEHNTAVDSFQRKKK